MKHRPGRLPRGALPALSAGSAACNMEPLVIQRPDTCFRSWEPPASGYPRPPRRSSRSPATPVGSRRAAAGAPAPLVAC
jgi:hypothetical protein